MYQLELVPDAQLFKRLRLESPHIFALFKFGRRVVHLNPIAHDDENFREDRTDLAELIDQALRDEGKVQEPSWPFDLKKRNQTSCFSRRSA